MRRVRQKDLYEAEAMLRRERPNRPDPYRETRDRLFADRQADSEFKLLKREREERESGE